MNKILILTLAMAIATVVGVTGLTATAIANAITYKPMDNCNSNGCDGWYTCDNPNQPPDAK